jgi:hypothetical protein
MYQDEIVIHFQKLKFVDPNKSNTISISIAVIVNRIINNNPMD